MGDIEDSYHQIPCDGKDSQVIHRLSCGRWLKVGIALVGASCFLFIFVAGGFEPTSSLADLKKDPAIYLEASEADKTKAQEEKKAGNAAYSNREFEEAIKHYEAAIALDDSDVTFLTNLAAVYYEQEEYDKCIQKCEEAMEKGKELRADYKLIAKAMTRKGSALLKKGELEEAVKVLKTAIVEHRTENCQSELKKAEKALKEKKDDELIDMGLCTEAKEKGNEYFKTGKFPEAVQQYTDAIKRGPAKVNEEAYKLYCNRAACYTKLMAIQDAIKDCDKCIELKPDFPKGYSRKGTAQFFMREYDKALETYRQGLEIAPDNEELKQGIEQCIAKKNAANTGMLSEAEKKEMEQKARMDPEVQQIMKDPVMQQVLKDMSENPAAAQKHTANPVIMAKIQKLVNAGIVKVQQGASPLR